VGNKFCEWDEVKQRTTKAQWLIMSREYVLNGVNGPRLSRQIPNSLHFGHLCFCRSCNCLNPSPSLRRVTQQECAHVRRQYTYWHRGNERVPNLLLLSLIKPRRVISLSRFTLIPALSTPVHWQGIRPKVVGEKYARLSTRHCY
jgi:hypothetical protein